MTGSLSPFTPFWGTERDIPNFCLYTDAKTNLDFFTLAQKVFLSRLPLSRIEFLEHKYHSVVFPSATETQRVRSNKFKKCPFLSTRSRCLDTHHWKTLQSPLRLLLRCALRMATERGRSNWSIWGGDVMRRVNGTGARRISIGPSRVH